MAFDIESLPVKVIKSRRKTISIELKIDGILVRAPQRMSNQQINAFLHQKSNWIEKHYKMMQEREKKLENLPAYTEEELKLLTEKARIIIPQKVEHYAKLIGVTYGRITIFYCRKSGKNGQKCDV